MIALVYSVVYWTAVLALSQTAMQNQIESWGAFLFWLIPFSFGLIVFVAGYVVKIWGVLQETSSAIKGNQEAVKALTTEVRNAVHTGTQSKP